MLKKRIALLTADPLCPVQLLARDSAFSLAARGMIAHQVGEALRADLVLTGTLRSLPSHFRLRAEMIRVADGTQIWVEDLLVPQARIAGIEAELANRLFFRLGTYDSFLSRHHRSATSDTESPDRREAYELFLRGHHEWQTLQRHRMQDGIAHLTRAIELDPTLYAAHIDFANACVLQTFSGFISPIQAAEQVRTAAESISPSVEGAEAILPPLGWIHFHVDHDLPAALRAFSSSAHLPHETSITRLRSMLALSRHRFLEAIELIDEALHADPYAPWLNARLAWAYHLSGEAEKAWSKLSTRWIFSLTTRAATFTDRSFSLSTAKRIAPLRFQKNLVRRSPYLDPAVAVHGYALAMGGRETKRARSSNGCNG